MTAVAGDGTGVVTLICDACGAVQNTTDVLNDEDIVWPSVNELGWIGSPFATGSHRCPPCAEERMPEPPAVRPPGQRPPEASFELRRIDDLRTTVVAPLSDLDQQIADAVRPAVMEAATAGRHIVVDLHASGVVDSAGLGLLVRAHREAKNRGGLLVLAAPSRFVRTVLHTMRLDAMFQTFPDRRRALAWINATYRRHDGAHDYVS